MGWPPARGVLRRVSPFRQPARAYSRREHVKAGVKQQAIRLDGT
ncbi:hypothetical protein AKJ09_10207 [Labilithrix luteola]|uniref:Uncharacterized protein n=1 Tax=Labilithrix luteola TaxID=1391654 RepID=A0A0K1QCR7_9BACT|nr:hypothetical protein AKJ09_10207 [Labilithrix luteola]